MSILTELKEEIDKQIGGKLYTHEAACGYQLLDIIGSNEAAAEIVLQDLKIPEMSLAACAGAIKKIADDKHKQHKGSFAFVSPKEAEEVIINFYKISEILKEPAITKPVSEPAATASPVEFLDFDSLF